MSDGAAAAEPLLRIRNLSKTFPGQRALDRVDLDIAAGEVHALCGQNGSGKSTLIKVLSGFHDPDEGAEIRFLGEPLGEGSSGRGRMHFIHQDLGLIPALDTAENLALGVAASGSKLRPIAKRADYRAARLMLSDLGMDFDVRAPVATLAPVERTMIAVARALRGWDGEAGLLVLDEPTVSLPAPEVQRLFDSVLRLKRKGAGILYVSHRLEELFQIADRVSVLRDGALVANREIGTLDKRQLVELIVGRALAEAESRHRPPERPRPVLRVENLAAGELLDVSFEVGAGEIVGVAGLVGSGMEQLPEVLFGARPLEAGSIEVAGTRVTELSPVKAVGLGIGLVPADRHGKGCIPAHSIRENLTLPELRSISTRLGINRRREREEASAWAARVELQQVSLERPMAELSGGNQQKVVIASRLRTRPSLLLLHEPTQGVDVGAKAAIFSLIARAAEDGMGVVAVSTDSDDLASFCDSVVVLREGRVVANLKGNELTVEGVTSRTLDDRADDPAAPSADRSASQETEPDRQGS